MAIRKMHRVEAGKLVYSSTFDQDTGTIMRMLPEPEDLPAMAAILLGDRSDFPLSYRMPSVVCPASPSPETIDVAITQKCGFGCSFCYQSSTPDQAHAPMELIENILTAFVEPPYQIAYGGGSPTTHPEFATILRLTRESNIVPNYTTEGAYISKEIIEATNKYCGGVSMTFHSWKGEEWFEKQYRKFDEAITAHKNIHLIFDRDVVKNMRYLMGLQERMGKTLSVILLAYYPDVGRGTAELLPTFATLHKDFPDVCREAVASGMKIAFSEGLLPYFLRRDLLDVSQAMASEGRYSCYISEYGAMRKSSFSKSSWSIPFSCGLVHSEKSEYDIAYEEEIDKELSSGVYGDRSYEWIATLGSIVENPTKEFQHYAKSCIYRAADQDNWGFGQRPKSPDGTGAKIDGMTLYDMKLMHSMDANEAWRSIRRDFTHDSGNDRYYGAVSGMDCRTCKEEWKCSKEDTSPVHLLMCKTAQFGR